MLKQSMTRLSITTKRANCVSRASSRFLHAQDLEAAIVSESTERPSKFSISAEKFKMTLSKSG